ncbi:MAG: M20/M25/M40 family metallo-hydrolase [Bacillota bacterium]
MDTPAAEETTHYRELAGEFTSEYCEKLDALVSRASVRRDQEAVLECARVLAEIMRDSGVDASIMPTEGPPLVLGRYFPEPANPDRPTLLVYGHYDVEDADASRWNYPPFALTRSRGRLYGRGTADDKGGILCHLMALKILRSATDEPSSNLVFLFEGGGESGSRGLAEFVAGHQNLLAANASYTADGPRRGDRPNLYLGVRGLLSLELRIAGTRREVHAGDFSGELMNPALEMARLLTALVGDTGECLVPGFHRDVREPRPGDLHLVENLRHGPEVAAEGLSRPDAYRRLLFRPSCNVSMLSAGDTECEGRSIVPGEARARLDFRLVPDQDPVRILGLIDSYLKKWEPDAEFHVLASMPPSRTDPEAPVVGRMVRILQAISGAAPDVYPLMTGAAPDFLFTRVLGIPSLWVPYADRDRASHAADENLRVKAAISGMVTSATVFRHLLSSNSPNREG